MHDSDVLFWWFILKTHKQIYGIYSRTVKAWLLVAYLDLNEGPGSSLALYFSKIRKIIQNQKKYGVVLKECRRSQRSEWYFKENTYFSFPTSVEINKPLFNDIFIFKLCILSEGEELSGEVLKSMQFVNDGLSSSSQLY